MLYDRIKQLTDVKLGLISFVSVDTKLSSQNVAQYLGNEALKINLKLGGQNQASPTPAQSCPSPDLCQVACFQRRC